MITLLVLLGAISTASTALLLAAACAARKAMPTLDGIPAEAAGSPTAVQQIHAHDRRDMAA